MGVLLSKIGALLSNWFGPSTARAEDASSEPSSVLSFHSSARWQLHFNSAKESSKLVSLYFTISIASCWIKGVFSRVTVVNSIADLISFSSLNLLDCGRVDGD